MSAKVRSSEGIASSKLKPKPQTTINNNNNQIEIESAKCNCNWRGIQRYYDRLGERAIAESLEISCYFSQILSLIWLVRCRNQLQYLLKILQLWVSINRNLVGIRDKVFETVVILDFIKIKISSLIRSIFVILIKVPLRFLIILFHLYLFLYNFLFLCTFSH